MLLMDESRAQIAAAVCTNYQMTYHAIDEVDVSVDLEDGTPVVTADPHRGHHLGRPRHLATSTAHSFCPRR